MGNLLRNLAIACTCLGVFLLSSLLSNQAHAQCPVNAAFTSSTVYVCQGSTVSFTNTTTGGAVFQGWFENTTAFSAAVNATRTFSTPGQFLISLIASNGSCQDTASTIIVVDPDVAGSTVATNATCFGYSDGALNLTPAGGTPNIAYLNSRAATNWSSINSVAAAGFTSGITVECWARPAATWATTSPATNDGMILGVNSSTAANRFLFGYNIVQQKFMYFDDAAGNRFQAGTSAPGNWYHVALTMTPLKNIVMYINGVSVLTYTSTGNCIPTITDLFSIGQEFDGIGAISQYFDGSIDEFRIWNTVLTPATIASNHTTCGPISSAHPNINNLLCYYSMNEGAGTFLFDRSGRGNHGTRIIGSTWTTPAATNYGCFNPGTGFSYTWSTGATTEDITGRPAGTYTVTITDGVGCTEIVSGTVGEPGPVTLSMTQSPNDSVCLGNSTVLTASGAATYTWTPAATLSAGTGTSVTATPTGNTTYTIIGTDGAGCIGTTTQTVAVLPLPLAVITGTNTICVGDTTTLNAAGGTTYAWSSGGTVNSELVFPSTTTTYAVTVTDIYGCQDTAQYPVTVNALPTVSFSGNTTICAGDSTLLTASGGINYLWSNTAITASTTVTPLNTSTYSVEVTDINNCSSIDSIEVVVNPNPVITFTGPSSICIGSGATISATGGGTWTWSNGDSTGTINVNPPTSTTYTVVVVDSNSCTSTDSFALSILALPGVLASGGDTICFGDSLTLSATGASTYLWSNGAPTSSVVVFPANTGFYSVVGTDSNGCVNSDSVEVVVNAPPAISISGPSQICEGSSAQFIASGGTVYTWSTGATGSSLLVSPLTGTYNYIVTVSNAEGCTNSAAIGLTVNPSPSASATGTAAVCVGASATITASGGGTYSWSTGATTSSITVTPASTNTYSVTVTSGTCTDTASHTVIVNPLPTTPVIVAAGNTMSTTAGFAIYQWFLNGNQISGANTDTYTGTVSGTYSVQVTDANGCSATSANFDFTLVAIGESLDLLNQAQLFPNPNSGSFSVSLDLDKYRELEFMVYDVVGHAVYQNSVKASAGSFQQDIQLQAAAKGVYFLHIRTGNASIVKKVVVE